MGKRRHRGIIELAQGVVRPILEPRQFSPRVIMLDCVTLHLILSFFINSKVICVLSGMFCSTKPLILLIYFVHKIPHSPHRGLNGLPVM